MQGYKVKLPCKRRRPRDVFISRSVCSGNKSGQYRRRYIRYLMRYRSWPSVLHCRPVNQFSLEKWSARTRHSRLSHGISSYWELKYHRVAFRCNTLVPQLSKNKLIIRTSGDHAFFASHTFLHEFNSSWPASMCRAIDNMTNVTATFGKRCHVQAFVSSKKPPFALTCFCLYGKKPVGANN